MSNNPGYMMASQVDAEVAKYRTLQESIQQQRSDLQILTNQSIENELVLSELQLVKTDESSSSTSTKVYKMVGPTLLKQDLEEAKETVQKRIEFIQGEQNKLESSILEKEKQADELAQKIGKMQAMLQQTTADAVNAIAAQHAGG